METFELYGIEQVLVDGSSLEKRCLTPTSLAIPVKILKAEELQKLIAKSDVVINL